MAKIVLIGNYKGGVGKTTSTFCLAALFAKMEKKVLVLDLDPQASLSEIMVKSNENVRELNKLPDEETLNYILDIALLSLENRSVSLKPISNDKLIKQCDAYLLRPFDYIPSSPFYSNSRMGLDELVQRMEDKLEYLCILSDYVDSVKDDYDYILLDTPPSNTLLTKSAILMSDYYVIPTILDSLSTNGIVHYIETVDRIYKKYCIENEDAIMARQIFGKGANLIGILCNLVRDNVIYDNDRKKLEDVLTKFCIEKDRIIHAKIDLNVKIARSVGNGLVTDDLIKKFNPVAKELYDRLENAG